MNFRIMSGPGRQLAIMFALFLGVLLVPSASGAFKYLTEGMEAPDVTGVDLLTGENISTKSWSKDNLVIVIFWSSWSPRSVEQLTDMKELVNKYNSDRLKFLAVNVDGPVLTPAAKETIVSMA
ncbi:MAG: redoxin domain-containing protein, partial [candidate division Zixibacteria bacterium]